MRHAPTSGSSSACSRESFMNSARLLITSAVPRRAPTSSWRRVSVAIFSLKFGDSNMAAPHGPQRSSVFGRGRRLAVLLVEAVNPACGIEQLLLAREERVAVRADIDPEVTTRGERLVESSTRAADAGR